MRKLRAENSLASITDSDGHQQETRKFGGGGERGKECTAQVELT